jgi:hypothetical protein
MNKKCVICPDFPVYNLSACFSLIIYADKNQ